MYGVVDGVFFCNQERLDEINERISSRNIPSEPLQPEFSPRPVSTKYAILPIVDRVPQSDVPLKKYPVYNVEKVFNPGTSQAPWRGFAENINVDSLLRNQYFALQKSTAAKFIPSSNSSLYTSPLAGNSMLKNVNEGQIDINTNKNTNGNGQFRIESNNTFNNCTRCQRMNINLDDIC
jgi:hypothetical protein